MFELFANIKNAPNLEEILTSETLKELSEDLEKHRDLIELLPESQRSKEFLRENLISSQLQQAMRVLSEAIRRPEGAGIFSLFELQDFNTSDINLDPLERLLKAIQTKSNIRKNRK